MTISLRLDDHDAALIKKFAEFSGVSMSELIRTTVLSKIEDEMDLNTYNKAYAEYMSDPETYSLDAVEKELGFK